MRKSVSIRFCTPPGDKNRFHEREISGVPKHIILEMLKDFYEYGGPESDTLQHVLYHYEDKNQNDCTIALDFGEIDSIFLQWETGTDQR